MNKVEKIIEKIKNKKIKMEDLVYLELDEQEFNLVMKAFEKSGIDIEENLDENKSEPEINYTNDIVKQYLEEIGKIPTLSREEEKELFSEYSTTKDAKIREKLIQSNLKLVVSVAKHYYYKTKIQTMDFLDLIQDGNEGLMKAIEKYDVTLGFKFSTYASWWIRQCITKAIYSNYKTVRVPAHMEEFVNRMTKYINEKSVITGEKPSAEEIASHFDVSVEKINVALELAYNTTISLEEKISEESNFTILDYTEDETIDIQNDYMIKQIYMDLRETIKEILNPREYSIISYRFGIVNDVNKCPNPMTLEQVANILGVTRERIRQIEAQALRKLRIKEQGNKIKYLKNN